LIAALRRLSARSRMLRSKVSCLLMILRVVLRASAARCWWRRRSERRASIAPAPAWRYSATRMSSTWLAVLRMAWANCCVCDALIDMLVSLLGLVAECWGCGVGEFCVVELVGDGDCAGPSCPVLGDDEVHFPGSFVVGVCCPWPVDEDDDVGVLLQGTGFPQVGRFGYTVVAHLGATVELGDSDNRHVALLGEEFDLAAELGHFLLP